MTLLYTFAGAVVLWILRRYWPVPFLEYVSADELEESILQHSNVKMLDVRDASDYLQEHLPGSVNISLGRLPYVWHKELSMDDTVFILSTSRYQSLKAARTLYKYGCRRLFAVQGNVFHTTGNHVNTKGCEGFGHRYNH